SLNRLVCCFLGLAIPLLVRRGVCGIKISAKLTLAPQTGWSLTGHVSARATTPAASRPPLLTRRGLGAQQFLFTSRNTRPNNLSRSNNFSVQSLIRPSLLRNHGQHDM